jgi:hypothetical protein
MQCTLAVLAEANAPILAAYWVIAPCSGCITASLQEQLRSAPSATGAFHLEAAPKRSCVGDGLTKGDHLLNTVLIIVALLLVASAIWGWRGNPKR